jgi:tetratricopeptide (TPR) repeat protein
VTGLAGKRFGIIGPLAAFSRRVAAKEVGRHRGQLRRGASRLTSHVVFGRRLLEKSTQAEIEERFDAETRTGRELVSENGFLRRLGLATTPESSAMTAQALRDQSKLSERDLKLLSLFDAFEHDGEPYSFRDLILAKKYAGLVAGGANWMSIARSVHRSGPVASLTALSLHAEGSDAIYARHGEKLSELDGQMLLPLGRADDSELEDLFDQAEQAEHEGRFEEAAALYQRCLGFDPGDAVAAYNRANCLKIAGLTDEAAHSYTQAVKLDPGFVEAWFNFAGLAKDRGQTATARRYLMKAITLDPDYADAVYNLAALEYDADNLAEARRWWTRYLELDQHSAWARKATRGVQVIDMQLHHKDAG